MDSREVAQRFEAKHLKLSLGLAVESLRFRDGVAAAYAGAGAYSNRICGFDLSADDIDPAVEFFTARGEDTKLEVTSFASPELLSAINARAFGIRFFTDVLAMPVEPVAVPAPCGFTIERLDRSDASMVRAVAVHNERCFATAEAPISEMAITLTMRHLRIPTNDTFLAKVNGELVGVGCSESSDGMTLVFGGATKPEYRNRGIQQALVAARLAIAKERGSDLLTLMAGPGTSSERNALRAGFSLAYARAYFNRPMSR